MATLQTDDLFIVRRPDGGDAGIYSVHGINSR